MPSPTPPQLLGTSCQQELATSCQKELISCDRWWSWKTRVERGKFSEAARVPPHDTQNLLMTCIGGSITGSIWEEAEAALKLVSVDTDPAQEEPHMECQECMTSACKGQGEG